MHPLGDAGRVIAGRYRLEDPIGRGAMGVVWRARDQLLDRDVAVKQLITGTPDHPHGAAADGVFQAVPPGDHPSGVPQWVHTRTIHAVR
jgi:serine/threonine protein kinase